MGYFKKCLDKDKDKDKPKKFVKKNNYTNYTKQNN